MMEQEQVCSSGFSLIETLVALFVIALISTSAGTMLLDTMNASKRVDESAGGVRELEVATGLIRSDLGAMTRRVSTAPDSYVPPAGPTGDDGSRDGLILSFVRGGWSDYTTEEALRSDLMRVEYHRIESTLVRRAYAAADPTARTPVAERVILERVSDIALRYYAAGGWSEVWQSDPGQLAPALPDLVEVTIVFDDGRQLTQKLLAGGLSS